MGEWETSVLALLNLQEEDVKASMEKIAVSILRRRFKHTDRQFLEIEKMHRGVNALWRGLKNLFHIYMSLLKDTRHLNLRRSKTLVDKVTEVRVEIEKALRRFHMDYMHFVEGGYEFGDEIDQETQKGRNCKIRSNALVVMQKYLITNFHNPYPHSQAKMELAAQSGLNVSQVTNWFINARERTIKKCCEQPSHYDKKKKLEKQKQYSLEEAQLQN